MDPLLILNLLLKTSVEVFVLYLAVSAFVVATQNWLVRGADVKRWQYWRAVLAGIPLLIVLIIASALVAPRLAGARTWSTVTSREGGFTIDLPGGAREMHQTITVPKVGDCPASIFNLNGGWLGVSYMAQAMDYPDGEKRFKGHEKDVLENVQIMTLKSLGLRAKTSQPIAGGKYPGIEFTYNAPKGVGIIQTRAYLAGSRLYVLWAGPLKNTDDPNGMKFFKSFKLTDEQSVTPGLKDAKH